MKIPDLWTLVPYYGFAPSQQLYSSLPMLHGAGELLPIAAEDHDVLFFNLTNVVDCLDKQKAKYDLDLHSVDEYVFDPRQLRKSRFSLFRLPNIKMVSGTVF